MTVHPASEYAKALIDEGLRTVVHVGWASTDRPGSWDPHGIVVHHTGPFSSVAGMIDLLRKGRPDLPGPLCHAGGRPDGTVDLVGWNDANHAGLGDARVLEAVKAEITPPPPRAPASTFDTVDGNANFYGIELMHPGDQRTAWPAEQVEAAVRYCAAVCRMHGWTANSVIFHRGWTRRKPDPAQLDITKFRARVTQRLDNDPFWAPGMYPISKPEPQLYDGKDPDVTLADELVKALEKALGDDDSSLSRRLRRQVRTAVDRELDERDSNETEPPPAA